MNRLEQQIQFILELDKLKAVMRRNKPIRLERYENSAEHSWHIALMALVLAEYADAPVEIGHVVKILLVHDIVEIDAGDTFVYDGKAALEQHAREQVAAERIFGLLPADQEAQFQALWLEYEEQKTPEAQFAKAIDRLMPLLHNFNNGGQSWQENQIRQHQVLAINGVIAKGSAQLWEFAQQKIQEAVTKGILAATG